MSSDSRKDAEWAWVMAAPDGIDRRVYSPNEDLTKRIREEKPSSPPLKGQSRRLFSLRNEEAPAG